MIRAGERATWPQVPAIRVTTRIGRTLDRILHAFEVDEAHWLRSAPQTDAALGDIPIEERRRRRKSPAAKRGKHATAIIEEKVGTMSRA